MEQFKDGAQHYADEVYCMNQRPQKSKGNKAYQKPDDHTRIMGTQHPAQHPPATNQQESYPQRRFVWRLVFFIHNTSLLCPAICKQDYA